MTHDNSKENRIEAAARSWAVYLHSGDVLPERVAEFESWLAADQAHLTAFRRYERLMSDLALIPELGEVEIAAVPAPGSRQRLHRPQQLFAAFAVMVVVLGGALVGLRAAFPASSPVADPAYETMVAEVRDIHLADGSVVTLGARSRIEPVFTDTMRIVKLHDGEAFFDVASDPERPFYVEAGDRLIRVVGTRFDVRQGPETVRVAVVEGIVEVLQAETPARAEASRPLIEKNVLKAGDEVVARIGSGEAILGAIEPAEAAPWRRGWLTYENASLAEIVSDANRYSRRQIILEEEGIGDLRMTAAFSVEKIDQFAAGLEITYGLTADYSDPSRIILSGS